jgi:nucleoside 2-deoxyribosyltransferase
MKRNIKIGEVGLLTNNVRRLADFYRTILGIGDSCTDTVHQTLLSEETMLTVYNDGTRREASNNSMCLVFTVSDIFKSYEMLSSMNVRIIEKPTIRPWGMTNMSFYDPDGNVVYFRSPTVKERQTLYFAGPLFSEAEKQFNESLTRKIEDIGIPVFLSQRDGVNSEKEEYKNTDKEKLRETLFEIDCREITKCGIFLFVLDGRVPDEGACFELGAAYTDRNAGGKTRAIIGLQTDPRAAFIGAKLNPMIKIPFDSIFDNERDLLHFLRTLVD